MMPTFNMRQSPNTLGQHTYPITMGTSGEHHSAQGPLKPQQPRSQDATLHDLFYNNDPPPFFNAFEGRVLPEPRLQHLSLPASYTDNFNVQEFAETLHYFDSQGMGIAEEMSHQILTPPMKHNINLDNVDVPMGVIAALSDKPNANGSPHSLGGMNAGYPMRQGTRPGKVLPPWVKRQSSQLDDVHVCSSSNAPAPENCRIVNTILLTHPSDTMQTSTIEATGVSGSTIAAQPAVKKRKRNRMAQKRYRDRKKSEANDLLVRLEQAQAKIQGLETDRVDIITEHTRNAVLLHKIKLRDDEIENLKAELAQLRTTDDEKSNNKPTSSTESSSSLTQNFSFNPLAANSEECREMVKDVVEQKFLADAYEHIADEFTMGCKDDRAQIMRLPLLLSFVKERVVS